MRVASFLEVLTFEMTEFFRIFVKNKLPIHENQIFTASAPCCSFFQKQLRSGVSASGGIPLLCQ